MIGYKYFILYLFLYNFKILILVKLELDMWEFNDGALKFYESVGFITYRRFMEFTNK